MNNKVKQGLLFGLLFGVPIVLFLLLRSGQQEVLQLQKFHPRATASGDTAYHTIKPFVGLVDQEGRAFDLSQLQGKVYIANFFFTRCPGICPKMMNNLKVYQKALNEIGNIRMISMTIDPDNDTVEVLKRYADEYKIDSNRWWLLTGDKENIYKQAKENFIISVSDGDGQSVEDFTHSERVMLIDKEGIIRGYYQGTDPKEIDRLVIETRLLLKYYRIKKST